MSGNNLQKETAVSPPNDYPYSNNDDEIDLIELILPLWRNKFLIILITLLTTAAAGAYVFYATPQYRISAQIKTSDSIINQKGFPRNFFGIEEIKVLLAASTAKIYGRREDDKRRPKIKISNPRRSRLGVVTLFWPDREQGKKILNRVLANINYQALHPKDKKGSSLQTLYLQTKNSIAIIQGKVNQAKIKRKKISLQILDEKEKIALVDIEAGTLKRKIKDLVLSQSMKEKELKSLQDKITVIQETKTEHEKNGQRLENDTNRIILLRNQLLDSDSNDKIQLLLLSNIVQQNISYMDTIAQKIMTARNNLISYRLQEERAVEEREQLKLKIAGLQANIDHQIPAKKSIIKQRIDKLTLQATVEIDSEIALLKQKIALMQKRKDQLALIDIVRPPFASLKPVKPNKKKSIALALISGLFLGVIIVYLRSFWYANKNKFLQKNLAGQN